MTLRRAPAAALLIALPVALALLAACAPRRDAPPPAESPAATEEAPATEAPAGSEAPAAAAPPAEGAMAPDDCDEIYALYELCYGSGVGRDGPHCAGLADDIAADPTMPAGDARAVGGFCGAACLAGASRYGLMPFPVFAAEYCGG